MKQQTFSIRLRAENLSAGYEGKSVVQSVELKLRQGEILALIGPNGAGKTTILKTLAGQLSPTAGTVYLGEEELQRIPSRDRARQLSVMLTQRRDAEYLTCKEMAAAGRYPYTGRLGILSEEDERIVEWAMRRLGAWELAQLPFDSVSDGQRQRVLLARALCQQPKVLLLDEPASYLDIRYQLELVEALRSLAREEGLAIIFSGHELDLVRRCADICVCLKNGRVWRIASVKEIFAGNCLEELFDLPEGSLQFSALNQDAAYDQDAARSRLRKGEVSGGQNSEAGKEEGQGARPRLRCGFTTGTCAALAARGAASKLLLGRWPQTVALQTPKGIRVEVPLLQMESEDGYASCAVQKDAGDDVDCTDGVLVYARVEFVQEEPALREADDPEGMVCIEIRGGSGIGRVTKPGLDQPVGEAAINSVPRQMIREAVSEVCRIADYTGCLRVTVSIPGGDILAEKTFNAGLGIEGGLSILGTSGIVEPMSRQALVDTILLSLRQQKALGYQQVILTPGNYGLDFLHQQGLDSLGIPVVKCSNYIGEALDECAALSFREVLLVGHVGKLVKLAGGIMNTHSKTADCRKELFCAHAAISGAGTSACVELMECATTEACLEILQREGLREKVMESLTGAVEGHLQRRAAPCRAGVILFSKEAGILGVSKVAEEYLKNGTEDGS